jgi:hypothetical protein
MQITNRDLQARLLALGFKPGKVDGMLGPKTRAARAAAYEALEVSRDEDLFHFSGLHRVHWHWTGGAHKIIALERKHYNGLSDRDGNHYDGLWRPEAQASYVAGRHGASHTLNANTGAIGEAVDAMAGAKERPFKWGKNPLTWEGINAMLSATGAHCRNFDIPISKWSTLTHAEIQANLGIRQRWKWDYTILPDMEKPRSAAWVGDRLRERLVDFV